MSDVTEKRCEWLYVGDDGVHEFRCRKRKGHDEPHKFKSRLPGREWTHYSFQRRSVEPDE